MRLSSKRIAGTAMFTYVHACTSPGRESAVQVIESVVIPDRAAQGNCLDKQAQEVLAMSQMVRSWGSFWFCLVSTDAM